jgi:hypothetical protein
MTGMRRILVTVACAGTALLSSTTGVGARGDEGGPEVTFTKWVLGAGPKMAGFTGGDAAGDFTGEVLSLNWTSTTPFVNFIYSIEAVYDVHAGSHSFTALIKGGENAAGKAFLDGRVIAGWLIGSPVHVTFQGKTNCADAPAGACFEGTIHIVTDSNHD